MFGIGGFELFLILIFGFLIFGPEKLPEIAQTVGRAIAKFRGAQESMSEQLKSQSFMDKDSENVFKNPLDVIESSVTQATDAIGKTRAEADAATEKISQKADSFAARKAAYDEERKRRKERKAEEAKAAKAKAEEEHAREMRENPIADVPAKQTKAAKDENGDEA